VSPPPSGPYTSPVTSPGAFAVALDESAGVLAVEGEVDEPAATALRDTLAEATDQYAQGLTVDLSEVLYLPSAAIGVLVVAQQKVRAAGGQLELRAREGTIAQRVLAVCGLPYRTS
jgi:anti-anti-sigma factor